MRIRNLLKDPATAVCMLACMLSACRSGPVSLFRSASPHEQYAKRLSDAGLDQTSMGASWISASRQSLSSPLPVTIPYRETGYFSADVVRAATYRFSTVRGQKLTFTLSKKPADRFMLYLDIWQQSPGTQPKPVASADTSGKPLVLDSDEAGEYLLRLQPELLTGGEYTLTITSGPSLGYPIRATGKNHIKSFFGDGRDADTRKHEGIDLFAPFHTPVVAAANGVVNRVNENTLGGKVVWMRPEGKNYTLYYAHLDSQIAVEGQQVRIGDTLGLMGNTGNARSTPPHLHFGIYTPSGAIDPLAFVNPDARPAPEITASGVNLNATVRNTSKVSVDGENGLPLTIPAESVMHVDAAHAGRYSVTFPDGRKAVINSRSVSPVTKAIRRIPLVSEQPLFDQPDTLAAHKILLSKGQLINVLGNFRGFYLVNSGNELTGWIRIP